MNKDIATKQNGAAVKLTGRAVYDTQVKKFIDWLDGRGATPELVAEYLSELKTERRGATCELAKTAIKAAIKKTTNDANHHNAIDAAFKKIKMPKPDKAIRGRKTITLEQIRLLKTELNDQQALIVETLAVTGLRVSELLNAKRKDIIADKNGATLRVTGKGNKEREVFLLPDVLQKIQKQAGKKYLFETKNGKRQCRHNLSYAISNAGRRLGFIVSPHTLRHTFATLQIKSQTSIKAVSQYLGHANTGITSAMYDHNELTRNDIAKIAV